MEGLGGEGVFKVWGLCVGVHTVGFIWSTVHGLGGKVYGSGKQETLAEGLR